MSLLGGGHEKVCLVKTNSFALMIMLSMPIQVSMIPFTGNGDTARCAFKRIECI